jgi:hypothetical protein
MQDADSYRRYADECLKLARTMPAHREKLIAMATTWQQLAETAGKREREKKTSERDNV